MLMLTRGVLLWSVAHLFKRLAPAVREGMGDLGKLVVTVALIGSLVMMISGYQDASGPMRWGRQPSWVSIIFFGGLLAWAAVSVILINRQDGKDALVGTDTSWVRESLASAMTVGSYGAVAHAHAYLAYPVHG